MALATELLIGCLSCLALIFLLQVLSTAARVGVPMSGENALQRYDQCAFDKICDSAFGQSVMAGRLEVRACVCVEDCLHVNCGNETMPARQLW